MIDRIDKNHDCNLMLYTLQVTFHNLNNILLIPNILLFTYISSSIFF